MAAWFYYARFTNATSRRKMLALTLLTLIQCIWSAEDEDSLFPALTLSPDQISVGVTLLDAEDFCVKTCSTEIAIKFASDQLFENFKRVLLHRNLSHVWHKFRQRDCACLELDSGKPVTIHLWEGVRLVWLHPLLKRNLSFEAPPISGRASVPCGSLAMESTSGTTRNSTSCAGRRSSRKTSTRYSHQVFTPGIHTRYSHQVFTPGIHTRYLHQVFTPIRH